MLPVAGLHSTSANPATTTFLSPSPAAADTEDDSSCNDASIETTVLSTDELTEDCPDTRTPDPLFVLSETPSTVEGSTCAIPDRVLEVSYTRTSYQSIIYLCDTLFEVDLILCLTTQ